MHQTHCVFVGFVLQSFFIGDCGCDFCSKNFCSVHFSFKAFLFLFFFGSEFFVSWVEFDFIEAYTQTL